MTDTISSNNELPQNDAFGCDTTILPKGQIAKFFILASSEVSSISCTWFVTCLQCNLVRMLLDFDSNNRSCALRS